MEASYIKDDCPISKLKDMVPTLYISEKKPDRFLALPFVGELVPSQVFPLSLRVVSSLLQGVLGFCPPSQELKRTGKAANASKPKTIRFSLPNRPAPSLLDLLHDWAEEEEVEYRCSQCSHGISRTVLQADFCSLMPPS